MGKSYKENYKQRKLEALEDIQDEKITEVLQELEPREVKQKKQKPKTSFKNDFKNPPPEKDESSDRFEFEERAEQEKIPATYTIPEKEVYIEPTADEKAQRLAGIKAQSEILRKGMLVEMTDIVYVHEDANFYLVRGKMMSDLNGVPMLSEVTLKFTKGCLSKMINEVKSLFKKESDS